MFLSTFFTAYFISEESKMLDFLLSHIPTSDSLIPFSAGVSLQVNFCLGCMASQLNSCVPLNGKLCWQSSWV